MDNSLIYKTLHGDGWFGFYGGHFNFVCVEEASTKKTKFGKLSVKGWPVRGSAAR